ncbi:MAG: ubiquinol-cytochrome c reductase iron-sulfur subunit [Acidobacteriia bacterium]|nr:ubiquinol-cytochrome c reductase iron-sulfur subunit [Terriglobia bacterium]
MGVLYALWGVIAGALGVPAFVYLFFPPKAQKQNEWVEAGDLGKLVSEQPVEMVFRRNREDGWKIISEKSTAWVVRKDGDGILAFGPQCTHLGCAYHWDEAKNEFVCPCHNSIFDVEGRVLSGPAPRPLDRYDVKVEGGKVLLGRLRRPPEPAL